MQIVWTAGLSFHSMNWLWKKLVFTLSGHFADPLSNVRKTFGSTSYLSLTDEMMENQPSFELRAQPKHVSVILCSGADPEFAPLKLKRNTRPHSCSLRKKRVVSTPLLQPWKCLFVCSFDYPEWTRLCTAPHGTGFVFVYFWFCTCILPEHNKVQRKLRFFAPV